MSLKIDIAKLQTSPVGVVNEVVNRFRRLAAVSEAVVFHSVRKALVSMFKRGALLGHTNHQATYVTTYEDRVRKRQEKYVLTVELAPGNTEDNECYVRVIAVEPYNDKPEGNP